MMVVLSAKALVYRKAVKKIYTSVVDQFYPWFKFCLKLVIIHYHVPQNKGKENLNQR